VHYCQRVKKTLGPAREACISDTLFTLCVSVFSTDGTQNLSRWQRAYHKKALLLLNVFSDAQGYCGIIQLLSPTRSMIPPVRGWTSSDWTGVDQSNAVSRIRVYFSLYRSFNGRNISRWYRIYRQNCHNFAQSGYSEVSGYQM